MFKKNLYLLILILAIGLSACGTSPETFQNLDLGSQTAQEQVAPPEQPAQGQAPDGQPSEGQPPQEQGNGQAPQGQDAPDGQQRPQIDLASVASTLGVTEDALISALGIPAGRPDNGQQGQGQNGQAPQGQDGGQGPKIDLATAASELGVTEEALKTALGEPGQGPPDFTAVAAELGVREEALIDALGVPAGGPPNANSQAQPSQG